MRMLPPVLASVVIAWAAVARAAVEVTPLRVEESRSAALVQDQASHAPDGLKVIFRLQGPEADSSVRYGDLKLQEAVDDQGTSLIPVDDPFHQAAQFKEYDNAFFRKVQLKARRVPDAPQVQVNLAVPKRSAGQIVRLRGSFSLAEEGTVKVVELTGLTTPGPKTLAIPPEAGIGIVVTVEPGPDVSAVGLQITGNENALDSIEVFDAAGRKVSNGISSWPITGAPPHKTLELNQLLDRSMKLVAKVAVDRKIIQVPFDLKNIPLP